MAVQERQYSDPTAGVINALLNLGGKQDSTTQTTTSDPRASEGLAQILNSQMGATTPQGAVELLRAIFQTGMQQVPGLAGTYAQAAGARTSNNSPFQLALQDLMLKLTNEGAKQLQSNQVAAAGTARQLAETTQTRSTQTTSKPKGSAMQALPFLLANAGKLKGLLPDDLAKSFGFSTGNGIASSPSLGGVGGFGSTASFGAGGGSFDLAPSVSFDGAAADSFSGSSFDAGSLVDFGGDFNFDSWGGGLDNINFFDSGQLFDGGGIGDLGFDFDSLELFADGGLVSKKKIASKTAKSKPMKGYGRAPGYAEGGSIRRNENIRFADPTYATYDGSTTVPGLTYNDIPGSLNELLTTVGTNIIGQPRTSTGAGGSGQVPGRKDPKDPLDAGSSGVGDGLATGQVGTPAQNSAAIAGLGIAAISAMTGIPGLGIALSQGLNAIGVPNTSMSPISQAISAIANALGIGGGNSGDTASVSPDSVAAATGIDGANNGGLGGLGVSMGIGPGDGFGGPGEGGNVGNDGTGAGGSGTGSGVGADGSASSGDGDSGVGGVGAYKEGGEIDGPGGPKDDSIVIRVSDGEYVVKADVVNALGVEFFDAVNSMFDGKMARSSKGAR